MTEIVIDTETTGLEVADGHRIIEVGIVEVKGFNRTGRRFQRYVNPMRSVAERAFAVHGLGDDFLRDKPTFDQIAGEFLEFIGDSTFVVHNAEFDIPFLNSELRNSNCAEIPMSRVIDTLEVARQKLPELKSHSMDALCKHFRIDTSTRSKHGALVDADLLVEVYIALSGSEKSLIELLEAEEPDSVGKRKRVTGKRPFSLVPQVSDEEDRVHRAFVATLGENSIWGKYL